MEVKSRFQDPEKVSVSSEKSPFNRHNKYKDCVNIFRGPNFVSPGLRCLLNRRVPKERFCGTGVCGIDKFYQPLFLNCRTQRIMDRALSPVITKVRVP